MVIVRGRVAPWVAFSEMAANTGTVGWQTLITCTCGPMWAMNSCTYAT